MTCQWNGDGKDSARASVSDSTWLDCPLQRLGSHFAWHMQRCNQSGPKGTQQPTSSLRANGCYRVPGMIALCCGMICSVAKLSVTRCWEILDLTPSCTFGLLWKKKCYIWFLDVIGPRIQHLQYIYSMSTLLVFVFRISRAKMCWSYLIMESHKAKELPAFRCCEGSRGLWNILARCLPEMQKSQEFSRCTMQQSVCHRPFKQEHGNWMEKPDAGNQGKGTGYDRLHLHMQARFQFVLSGRRHGTRWHGSNKFTSW